MHKVIVAVMSCVKLSTCTCFTSGHFNGLRVVIFTWPYKCEVWYVCCACTEVSHEEDYTGVTDCIFSININWNRDVLANKVRQGVALNTSCYDRSVEATLSPFHHRGPVASEANAAAQSLEFTTIS